ncbi:protein LBH-like isoform X2 [Scyliorhinus torazame]|uniref:protein LBH-like isoform X2 n=1 Tax=Scyliorhinus torazame TaxID=75743 RepID=UPI003B591973
MTSNRITASDDSAMTDVLISSCKLSAEELGLKHDENRLPFQIFPDPCDSYEGQCKLQDRLPSIVVEPTDVTEVESGELRWPPEELLLAEQGEGEGLIPHSGERGQAESQPASPEGQKQQEDPQQGHCPPSSN